MLLPDEDRWKDGCCGRLGASDMRDEDTERAWCEVCDAVS
jgi:hypothetical protein